MEQVKREEGNVCMGEGVWVKKRKGWGPVISLPELLGVLPLDLTRR